MNHRVSGGCELCENQPQRGALQEKKEKEKKKKKKKEKGKERK